MTRLRAMKSESDLQRRYYARAATEYDNSHSRDHDLAITFLLGWMRANNCTSLLDIGSGTGLFVRRVLDEFPEANAVGIEPVPELRAVGYRNHGLSQSHLRAGNAVSLDFPDDSFDVVTEFGMLHHVKKPRTVIAEMLRVARKAVLISDCNNFGQGRVLSRFLKQTMNALGLWGAFDTLRTLGRGYQYSEGDGVFYSYSVFNDWSLLREACREVLVMNAAGVSVNHYREASHVVVLGVLKAPDKLGTRVRFSS